MAFEFAAGTFESASSIGNQSISGLGFQPKLVIFYSTATTHSLINSYQNFGPWMIGAAVSSSAEGSCSTTANHSSGDQDGALGQRNDECIHFVVAAATFSAGRASFVSMDSDGFTINWASVFASATRSISYVAFGGSDLTNVSLTERSVPVSTGDEAVTGLGYQPDALIVFGNTITTSNSTSDVDPQSMALGFSDGTNDVMMGMAADEDSDPIDVKGIMRNDKVFETYNISGSAVHNSASVKSLDSDGWTLNWSTVNAADKYFVISIKANGGIDVGTDDVPGSTGTNKTATGVTPTGVLVGCAAKDTSTTWGDDMLWSLGGYDGSNQNVQSKNEDDGPVTSLAGRYSGNTKVVYTQQANSTIFADGEAAGSSLNSDGFTLNWTNIYSGNVDIMYLAFGAVIAGSTKEHSASSMIDFAQQTALANEFNESVSSLLDLAQSAMFKRDIDRVASSLLDIDHEAVDLAIKLSVAQPIVFSQSATHNLKFESVLHTLGLTDSADAAETILAVATSVLDFVQTANQSVKFESVANMLDLQQIIAYQLGNDIHVNAENILTLDHDNSLGNFVYNRSVPGQSGQLLLDHSVQVAGERAVSVESAIDWFDVADFRTSVVNKSLTSFLSFAQQAGRVRELIAASDLDFIQAAVRIFTSASQLDLMQAASAFTVKPSSSTLEFLQTLSKTQDYGRTIAQVLGLAQSVAYIIGDPDLCNYSLTVGTTSGVYTVPSTIAPTLMKSTLTLRWPAASPSLTVTLKNPEFGNTDTLTFQRINRTSRGGTLLVFADPTWPKHQRMRLQIDNMKATTRNQLRGFLLTSLGTELLLDDWEGRTWQGLIVNPDAEITQTGRDQFSVTLEFEGELV